MNRITALLSTPFAQVFRFDHPPETDHRDAATETPSSYGISFIEAGCFSVARGRNSWTFHTNDIELAFPGDSVSYRHPPEAPDDLCIAIHFTHEAVAQTLGTLPPRGRPLRIPASDRTIFERYRLTHCLESKDTLGIDLAIQNLIPVLFGSAQEWKGELHRSSRFPFYLRRIRDAVELLNAEFSRQHSLFALARRIAISPYHFSRIFTALVGRPPHQYLTQVRLLRASRRLLDGSTVTNAAFDCGFQNLSHFTRMFRKRFGVSPGNFRNLRSPSSRANGNARDSGAIRPPTA